MRNYFRIKNEWLVIIPAFLITLAFSRIFSSARWTFIVLWSFFWLVIFYQVFRLEDIFFLRRFVFIFLAVSFLAGFRLFLLNYNDLIGICPLVVSTLVGIKLKTIFTVGKYFYLFLAPLIFLLLILFLGLRWCSSGCFWGGWNELFAGVLPKRIISVNQPGYFRELPVALWLFFSIIALTGGEIFFCLVLCPFKLISIPAVFIGFLRCLWLPVLLLLVIVLPLLTKKHFFCRFLCPLKGFLSLFGRRQWQLRIDEKCNNCQVCLAVCPEMAILNFPRGLKIDVTYCSQCLRCISVCPQQAIVVLSSGNLLSKEQVRQEFLFTLTVVAVVNSFWGPVAFQHLLGLK